MVRGRRTHVVRIRAGSVQHRIIGGLSHDHRDFLSTIVGKTFAIPKSNSLSFRRVIGTLTTGNCRN